MQVLVIKTSSMADVIHTLPAITDARRAIPGIRFDWVVEEAFAALPGWHPAVQQVIPVALRRWRRNVFAALKSEGWREFRRRLRYRRYDFIVDAQGLLQSAWISRLASGRRVGFDRHSAREGLASFAYDERYGIETGAHAVTRLRRLFAASLGYRCPDTMPDYGIDRSPFDTGSRPQDYLVWLHGTTWSSKQWPDSHWRRLTDLATAAGFDVHLPWGNNDERRRAFALAAVSDRVTVLPRMDLAGLARELAGARAVVGVDSGPAHLAAALAVPALVLYGSTDPALTGTLGGQQWHLSVDFRCAPCLQRHCAYTGEAVVRPACYATLAPESVWTRLAAITGRRNR